MDTNQIQIFDHNGTKIWRLNGKLHREDGAAVERADGGKAWYLNGRCYDAPEYWARATLKYQGKCFDEASVGAFLQVILKKYINDAL